MNDGDLFCELFDDSYYFTHTIVRSSVSCDACLLVQRLSLACLPAVMGPKKHGKKSHVAKAKARQMKSKMNIGDWRCHKCDSHNYNRRLDCFRCGAKKTAECLEVLTLEPENSSTPDAPQKVVLKSRPLWVMPDDSVRSKKSVASVDFSAPGKKENTQGSVDVVEMSGVTPSEKMSMSPLPKGVVQYKAPMTPITSPIAQQMRALDDMLRSPLPLSPVSPDMIQLDLDGSEVVNHQILQDSIAALEAQRIHCLALQAERSSLSYSIQNLSYRLSNLDHQIELEETNKKLLFDRSERLQKKLDRSNTDFEALITRSKDFMLPEPQKSAASKPVVARSSSRDGYAGRGRPSASTPIRRQRSKSPRNFRSVSHSRSPKKSKKSSSSHQHRHRNSRESRRDPVVEGSRY